MKSGGKFQTQLGAISNFFNCCLQFWFAGFFSTLKCEKGETIST